MDTVSYTHLLIGGLALFLYGMNAMGDGLAKVSGGKLEKILENLTSNPIKAVPVSYTHLDVYKRQADTCTDP